jgi:hypothetical protein
VIKPCYCGEPPVRCIGLAGYCAAHAPSVAVAIPARMLDPQPRALALTDAERELLRRGELGRVGETVAYTLGHGPARGQQRPAIVVRLLPREGADARVVLVACRPGDGLEVHEAGARYSARPLSWHWSARTTPALTP